MKNIKCIILFMVVSFFISENAFCQNRWWQREIPAPSANQMINPNYLSRKREIEIQFDDINKFATQRNNYAKAGQTESVKSADEMLQFMGKKMNTLEYELSKIPMYITKPDNSPQNNTIQNTNQQYNEINVTPSSGSSSSSASNPYQLTLYKIKNCNKGDFKSDYEYNVESLNLFNELKKNLTKIVESETDISYSSTKFTWCLHYKEKIKYYELFVKNWGEGKTIGTQEAQKEINTLNEYIIEEEKIILKNNTDVIIKFFIKGNLPADVTHSGHNKYVWYRFACSYYERNESSIASGCPSYYKVDYSNGPGGDINIREFSFSLKERESTKNIYKQDFINILVCYYLNEVRGKSKDSKMHIKNSFNIESIPVIPKKTTYVNIYFTLNGTSLSNAEYKISYE